MERKQVSKEDKIIELLEELVKWVKVTSITKVKEVLIGVLKSPEEIVAYQSSDGRASGEVSKEANVSYVTVTLWWKNWIKAGIAEPISARGGQRAKRVFSLDDFGIEVPKNMKTLPKSEGGKNPDKQDGDVEAS
jgi:hypothetical protein